MLVFSLLQYSGEFKRKYFRLYSRSSEFKIRCEFWRVIKFWSWVSGTPKAKAICDDNFASVGERNMPFIRTRVGIKALKRNCCQRELCWNLRTTPTRSQLAVTSFCSERDVLVAFKNPAALWTRVYFIVSWKLLHLFRTVFIWLLLTMVGRITCLIGYFFKNVFLPLFWNVFHC